MVPLFGTDEVILNRHLGVLDTYRGPV